jgi:hypothetical protein
MAATRRRLGPWLVGLFLIGQIFGVVPLMSGHTAHVAETQLALSNDNARTGSIHQGHHHRGDADGFIQHHELQDLGGALTCLVRCYEIAIVHVAFIVYPWDGFTQADPVRLERPPKPLLSV